MMLGFFAALFSACQKEDANDGATPSVHFTINADVAASRTAITDNGDGTYTPSWQKNDQLAVFFGFPVENMTPTTFENTANDGTTASFEATVNDVTGEQTLYAFYPQSAFAKNYNSNSTTGLNLSTTQQPSLNSFDPAADILVAKPKTITVSGTDVTINDMAFARMISVAKVVLNDATGGQLADEKVLSVKIAVSDSYDLAGRMRVDMNTAKIIDYTTHDHEVIAKYDVEDNFVINGTNAAYLCVFPTVVPAGETVEFLIETENYEITKSVTLSSDLAFPISNVAKITLNIQESELEAKVAETRIFVESFDAVTVTKTALAAADSNVTGTGVSDYLTYTYSAANCNIRFNGSGQTSTNPFLYINAAGSSMTISNIVVENETNLIFTVKVAQFSSNKQEGNLTVRYKESSADEWTTAGVIASAPTWGEAEASLGLTIANTATSIDLQLEGDAVMVVDDLVLEAGTYVAPDVLTVSKTSIDLGYAADAAATFEVFANNAWTLATTGSGFTVSPSSGAANTTTVVTVTASAAGGEQDADLGSITVTAGDKTETIAISQKATPADGAKYYTEVTVAPADWSGTYLLVEKTNSIVANGNISSGTLAAVAASIDANGIEYNETYQEYEFTITKSTNGYYIQMPNNQYVAYNSSTNFTTQTTPSTDKKSEWTIEIQDDQVVISNDSSATTRYFGWNKKEVGSGAGFKAYAVQNISANLPVTLYKAPTE